MKKTANIFALLCLMLTLCGFQNIDTEAIPGSENWPKKRPFYEYPGNYGEEVQKLMDKFKGQFGYELVEFGEAWRKEQVESLHAAFLELPPTFHQLPGMKGLYRLSRIMVGPGQVPQDEIPAAMLPAFITIHEAESKTYQVLVNNEDPRVEFYTPLFYEDTDSFKNIVQHEMAHAFDMTQGFLSFSDEWVALTKFRLLHMPPLDAKPGSNFIYTFLNDPKVDNYAPISKRHLPTYSRQNIQEDFANSVAAYIHYPYFQYTHPARYKFLQERVFAGKVYFPADASGRNFEEIILADFNAAVNKKDWQQVTKIIQELSRGYYPELEVKMANGLAEAAGGEASEEKDYSLAFASCYLIAPEALEFRKNMIRQKRIETGKVLKNERCFRIGRDNFQRNLAKWAPANVVFFREEGRDLLQFLDPVLGVAHARGYNTRYIWRIFAEGAGTRPIAEGNVIVEKGGNGSVQLDLKKIAEKNFSLPEGRKLILELGVTRMHPRNFKTFDSEIAKIRFVVHPWFQYIGPGQPKVHVVYPLRASYQHRN